MILPPFVSNYIISRYRDTCKRKIEEISGLISAAESGGGNEGGKTPSVSLWLTPPSVREAGEKNGDTLYNSRARARIFADLLKGYL
jgi:hypothetical protein